MIVTTDDELGPLRATLEGMTDEEVDEWLEAGKFESVRGVALPAQATANVAALVSGSEVQGFTLNFNVLGGAPPPLPLDGTEEKGTKGGLLFQHCCKGTHFKEGKL